MEVITDIINKVPRDLKFYSEESIKDVYRQVLVSLKAIADRQYRIGDKNTKRSAVRFIKQLDMYLSKPLPTDRIKLLETFYNTFLNIESSGTLMGFEYHSFDKVEGSYKITGPSLLNPETTSLYQYHRKVA